MAAASLVDGYQFKSGLFMEIYIAIVIGSTIAFITISSVTATMLCCIRSNSESLKNLMNDENEKGNEQKFGAEGEEEPVFS